MLHDDDHDRLKTLLADHTATILKLLDERHTRLASACTEVIIASEERTDAAVQGLHADMQRLRQAVDDLAAGRRADTIEQTRQIAERLDTIDAHIRLILERLERGDRRFADIDARLRAVEPKDTTV
jgi:uncharacterized phage infection (PIP) family protein YhgE